jgi:DNA excision repair protein ERCC-5
MICKNYGVSGSSQILFKIHGDMKTHKDPEVALSELKEGLRSEKKAYIYHCQGHYFLIFGYESHSTLPVQAYSNSEEIKDPDEWIVIGEISRLFSPFHIKKWSSIFLDLKLQYPK